MLEVAGSSGMYAVIGIIVIAVASLLGLVIFASKEEKFEDVVEAQKREQEALLQSLNASTSKPSKSKKKWVKIKTQKKAKAEKSEPEAELEIANVSEQPSDQVVPSVPPPTEAQSKKSKKKRSGSEKSTGKDVVDHKSPKVKDDAPKPEIMEESIKQEQIQFDNEAPTALPTEPRIESAKPEKKQEKKKDIVSEVIAEIKESELSQPLPVAAEEKQKSHEPQQQNQKKTKPKKAKPQVSANDENNSAQKIAKDLEQSQFNAPDVQRLIDILLDKQNELQQWKLPNKKGDIVEDLGKRCHDLEEQLTEEKKTSLVAAQEIKELGLKIQHERAQLQRMESQANQKINQQAGEIHALQKRMEMTQEAHLREMQNAQSQLQQMKEVIDKSAPVDMQRLKEENAILKNASLRTQQLADEKNALVAEYSQLQQSSNNLRTELDSKLKQIQQHSQQVQLYEEQNKAHENEIQQLRISKSDVEKMLSEGAAKFKDQIVHYENENNNLLQQLQHAQKELQSSNLAKESIQTQSSDSAMWEEKLSASATEIENLNASLKTSEEKLKQYQEAELQNAELLKKLAEEKKELQDKIELGKDDIVMVEKPPSNGIHTDDQVSHEEHQQIITEKDKVISELKEDVKSTKEELEKLANVMQQEKDENVNQLNDTKINLEEEITKLKNNVSEEKAEKKKVEEALEIAKGKNNDLREKNWKAMDALATTEANSKKKAKETEEAVYRALKKIRPSIKLEKNQPIEVVLQEYQESFIRNEEEEKAKAEDGVKAKEPEQNSEELEKLRKELEEQKESNDKMKNELDSLKKEEANLTSEISKLKKEADSSSSMAEDIKKLSDENKKSCLQIDHYKTVLEETETMLKKLQARIESEVTSYEKKLNDKDQELKQLKEKSLELEETLKNNDDKTQLEIDLKKMQDELETEKKAKIQLGTELEELKQTSSELEEKLKSNDEKTQLETDLKQVQDDLESEKKAKSELQTELEEAQKRVSSLEEDLENTQNETGLAQSQESLNSSTGSTSPKKKKGFKHAFSKKFNKKGEAIDDAKQLSAVQEQLSKIEAEKSELAKKLSTVSDAALAKDQEIKKMKTSKDSTDKELAKLKEKLSLVEKAGKDGKSSKDKDKIIAKLTLENAELREDLQDERDRVVVDVESVDSEKLKSDLSTLQEQFDQEKDSSKKLNTSIQELEEKLNAQKAELEKKESELAQMEQKYKEAADQTVVNQQKIQELELAGLTKSERIEMEIDDAINQTGNTPTSPQRSVGAPLLDQLEEVKSNLTDKEKQLENEKSANKQLRAQLAALTSNVTQGTSV